jgi:hypothetical protein
VKDLYTGNHKTLIKNLKKTLMNEKTSLVHRLKESMFINPYYS